MHFDPKVRMDCPLDAAMSVIEGRWKTVILCRMAMEGRPVRFKEFMEGIEGISSRMLVRQLREMEEDRLVTREVFPEVPPRVEYSLTPRARSLLPILRQLAEWGRENMFNSSVDISALLEERQPQASESECKA